MAKEPRRAIEISPLHKILGRLGQGANPFIEQVMRQWRAFLGAVANPAFTLRSIPLTSGSMWVQVPNPEQDLRGVLAGYLALLGETGKSLPTLLSASQLPVGLPAAPEGQEAQQRLTQQMPWGVPPWWNGQLLNPPDRFVAAVNTRLENGLQQLTRVLRREIEGAMGPSTDREPWNRLPPDLREHVLESAARSFSVAFALAALQVPGDTLDNISPLLWGMCSGVLPVAHHPASFIRGPITSRLLVA